MAGIIYQLIVTCPKIFSISASTYFVINYRIPHTTILQRTSSVNPLPDYGVSGHDELGFLSFGIFEKLALGLNEHVAVLSQTEAVHSAGVRSILCHWK